MVNLGVGTLKTLSPLDMTSPLDKAARSGFCEENGPKSMEHTHSLWKEKQQQHILDFYP